MRGSILSFGSRQVNVISIPPVGFRSAGFVSGGQVKPGLSPLWPLAWKEDKQISAEELDMHRSLHNQQSKSISPRRPLKRYCAAESEGP